MILCDMNGITIGAIMAESKGKPAMDENLIRHIVMSSLLYFKRKFGNEYGEMVLCFDSGRSWRKNFYPHYKHKRAEQRAASTVDWKQLHIIINTIFSELDTFMPYKCLSIQGTEADDIIAVLAKEAVANNDKVLIISSDSDFQQLVKDKSVRQYSPCHKNFIACSDPDVYLFDHVLHGDASDGVPNILSADDVFVKKIRQTPLTKKKFLEFQKIWTDQPVDRKNIFAITTDPDILDRINRNVRLINLTMIPQAIQDDIMKVYTNLKPKDRSKMLTYFTVSRLANLIADIGEF